MKTNQLKAGTILSYLSMIISSLISILFTPVMLRLLGQSEYGLYNLVSSVVSYLGLLSFGFGSAYIRFYSRYKVKEDEQGIAKLNGMFLTVFSIIGLIAIIAGIFLVANVDVIFGSKLTIEELSTAKILMSIMVFNLALSFPASVFSSHITANEKFIFQKGLQIVKAIISPFVMLPLLLMGYKSVGVVVITTVLNIMVEIINAIFCVKKLKMRFFFKQFDFVLIKEMAVFSSYLFMNMIIDQVNWNLDKFILGRFRGTISVAIYGVASQLNAYYLSFSTTISGVFVPRVNRMVASKNSDIELTDLFTRIGRIQFIILSLISSGFILFGKPFITMWAGSNYQQAYPIALLLIIPVTIPLIQNIGIEIQKAKNMHKFRSWLYLFMALGNLLLSIPLAKMMGGVGAALGTAISLFIGNGIIMNLYYHLKIGLNMKFFWSQIIKIVPALVIPTITGVLIHKAVNLYNVSYLFVSGVIYVLVFCISMWFLGMNKYEKELISKPVIRVLKK